MNTKPDKLVPSIIGGVIIGIFSTIPGLNFINCFCCAGIILGGFAAVFIYKKTGGEIELTYSDGALLGVLSGILGVIFGAIINSIIGTNVEQVLEQVMQNIDDLPPEAEEILFYFKEHSGQLFMLGIATSLVLNVIFGLLGGIIGVSILGKKE